MSSWTSVGLLLIVNGLLPLPFWLFATGFFPYKPMLPGQDTKASSLRGHVPAVPFDRVIFMVVDALRSDFVFSKDSAFNFLHGLVESGAAIPFTAHASPPTVTMPRIKALTTGSTPSFLDVILNFAESDSSSSLATQDSWLKQLLSVRGGPLLMYGDDTWLKLFPGLFTRADGTSSFFVSDFIEVDNNVTRHLPHELDQSDWTGMVLHFLGLDHIGHKGGPRSVHMRPKQEEMDSVVEAIYGAFEAQDHLRSTLLVLCGDHGMNDAGNHGGSSTGETSAALVFISPQFRRLFRGSSCPADPTSPYRFYDLVKQLDIVPTLATLLGFPIPSNNLGVIIPQLLEMWPDPAERLDAVKRNVDQMTKVLVLTHGPNVISDSVGTHCAGQFDTRAIKCHLDQTRQLDNDDQASMHDKIAANLQLLYKIQDTLSSAATEYNTQRLFLGLIGAIALALLALAAARVRQTVSWSTVLWICAIMLCQALSMFSSSFIEEEHHVWHWLSTGWAAWLYVAASRRSMNVEHLFAVAVLCLARIERQWNQTGQKHTGDTDIGKTYLTNHPLALIGLVAFTYLGISRQFGLRGYPFEAKSLNIAMGSAIVIVAFIFKFVFTGADAPELLPKIVLETLQIEGHFTLIVLARLVFGGLGTITLFSLYRVGSSLNKQSTGRFPGFAHCVLTLLLTTQSRINNIPLYLLFNARLWLLRHFRLGSDEITVSLALFQQAAYHTFGGSNSISSVDLSNAYNGVDKFNVLAVGFLVFLSNWVGPVWWSFAFTAELARTSRGNWAAFVRHLHLLCLLTSSSIVMVMLTCIIFRAHLFVWTVFSPKYLYCVAWGLGQHLLINVVFGSFAFWTGTQDIQSSQSYRQ